MSDQFNSFSNPINEEVVNKIEQLDLDSIQKHHLRILAHCLAILNQLAEENNISLPDEKSLMKWCEKESKKINDEKFSSLLFDQMSVIAKKLNNHSKKIGKTLAELNLQDLIYLIQQKENSISE